ncbi:MAG: DUF1467 family protein [Pseudomonadota bacterium]
MSITSIIVVYAVSWFMCLFIVLPLRLTTQNDTGEIAPGTAPSAPSADVMRRKIILTTLIATVVWAVLCAIIMLEVLTVADLDVFNRM